MILDAVQVDDEAMVAGLLPALERAFGVRFDRDLRHVRTAGDLFRELIERGPATGAGDRHATSMAFYALRRELAPLLGGLRAESQTGLRDSGLPSPKRLAVLLARGTGLAMPEVPISMFGWLLAGALVIAALIAFILGHTIFGVVLLIAGMVPLKLDRGEYGGDWETLGSLTRAVERLNYADLADLGARDTEADRWRAFVELLAPYAFVGRTPADPRRIGPDTVLRFT